MLNKIYKDTEIINKLINELTWDKKINLISKRHLFLWGELLFYLVLTIWKAVIFLEIYALKIMSK